MVDLRKKTVGIASNLHALTRWNAASDSRTATDFDMIGGMVGFACWNGVASVDDFTLKSWDGSGFNVTEHVDTFDIDGNGRSANDPAYDLAGNLTFDGTQKFTFDAWNRVVKVAHAYRDGGGTVQSGQANVTMTYDGRGRRVKKAIVNSGQWDATYKYYYDQDSLVETRNGSDKTLKQHVWGTRYIDELVQISINDDPTGGEQVCEANYWACQDANYNVLGVVDSSAVLEERYEYKPYGERTVLFSCGTNDVGCYMPTAASRRVLVSSVAQPYGICEIGHQGLVQDEEGETLSRYTPSGPVQVFGYDSFDVGEDSGWVVVAAINIGCADCTCKTPQQWRPRIPPGKTCEKDGDVGQVVEASFPGKCVGLGERCSEKVCTVKLDMECVKFRRRGDPPTTTPIRPPASGPTTQGQGRPPTTVPLRPPPYDWVPKDPIQFRYTECTDPGGPT